MIKIRVTFCHVCHAKCHACALFLKRDKRDTLL